MIKLEKLIHMCYNILKLVLNDWRRIMSRILFKSDTEMSEAFAVLCDNCNEYNVRLSARRECGEEYLAIEFDSSRFTHIYFECDGEKTGKVYPGDLSIGIEYKENASLNKKLTYLFSEKADSTGRVDNFTLDDGINLAYRNDKRKKISVFLPKSYDGVTPHDILYFFDAQNLFGAAGNYTDCGDPYGSWQLDTALSFTEKNVIVVGIDNADEYRESELFMSPGSFGKLTSLATAIPEEEYREGYLDRLSDFMINTLHPFIKGKYCVKEENIGIGGASMGGIAAFYCGLREMGFYKYILSYSPAFALYEINAFDGWFKKSDFYNNNDLLPKIHIYCGEGDPLERLLVGAARGMKEIMVKNAYPPEKIYETFDAEKPHNEESWRLILPQSFTYLL